MDVEKANAIGMSQYIYTIIASLVVLLIIICVVVLNNVNKEDGKNKREIDNLSNVGGTVAEGEQPLTKTMIDERINKNLRSLRTTLNALRNDTSMHDAIQNTYFRTAIIAKLQTLIFIVTTLHIAYINFPAATITTLYVSTGAIIFIAGLYVWIRRSTVGY